MALLPASGFQGPESGVNPAGAGDASKLLRSVSAATKGLVAKIQSCDAGRHRWMPAAKVAAELKEAMLRIRGVLLDADLQRAPGGRALVLQARCAAHGLEDLLDTVDYRRLHSELAPPPKFRMRPLLSAAMLRNHLLPCDGVASSKQSRLLKELRLVIQQTRKLAQLLAMGATAGPSSLDPPLLDSPDSGSGARLVLPRDTVVGRDMDRDAVLRMLTEPRAAQPNVGVISIIGWGGVGKTTLARLVYNDPSIERHFDVKTWVSVSTGFDLAAEILSSAQPSWGDSSEKMVASEKIQSELSRFVSSKRCLIVLDGMWPEIACQDILTPLRSAGSGSKILVTTRADPVPHMLLASQIYHLAPLGTDDCWALIKEHAFRRDGDCGYPELQLIGRAIAAKIHGSPLAAKVIGQLLRATRSKEKWNNIMCSLLPDDAVFPGLRTNIMGASSFEGYAVLPALRLSYNHLPAHLKRCFAYCSLFPKNWKFDPTHLIQLWIAEGFVQPQCRANERMEDTARQYFDQLLSCSLLQELKLGPKVYYLVHDLLHDLAESVAAEDFFRIGRNANRDIPLTVCHLSVTTNNLDGLISFPKLKKLRTLLILRPGSFSSNCLEEDLLGKLTNLRVLDLTGCNLRQLPRSIGNLMHLRYLSVHSTIQMLPESIGKLLHLQYLCFSETCSLDKLPASINRLVNLRHLGVDPKYTAGLASIGRLVNLQGSLELHVDKLGGRTLQELRNINGLDGSLKIKGLENVSGNKEACRAELKKKRYLKYLSLEWSSAHRKLHPPADTEVLEALMPHPHLKELHIMRYCGTEAPSWLESPSLQHLQSLHLINCRDLGILPPLGHLPSLRTLHMRELCAVDRIGPEFYGTGHVAFPSLSFLEIDDFPRLREWAGIANKKSFPCLERLMLIDCPELTLIPLLPPTTTEVTIERIGSAQYIGLSASSSSSEMLQLDVCASSVLFKGLLHKEHIKFIVALNITDAEYLDTAEEELGSLVSLQRLQLNRCDFNDQTFSKFLQALPCLSSLEIRDLPKITSLPVLEKLKFCTMLKELYIRNCQLLRSLSSLQFFDSIRCLVIERCPKLTATSFPENFGNISSLKVLRISDCPELQSLPVSGLPSLLDTLHLVGCHPQLSRTIKKHEGAIL